MLSWTALFIEKYEIILWNFSQGCTFFSKKIALSFFKKGNFTSQNMGNFGFLLHPKLNLYPSERKKAQKSSFFNDC